MRKADERPRRRKKENEGSLKKRSLRMKLKKKGERAAGSKTTSELARRFREQIIV